MTLQVQQRTGGCDSFEVVLGKEGQGTQLPSGGAALVCQGSTADPDAEVLERQSRSMAALLGKVKASPHNNQWQIGTGLVSTLEALQTGLAEALEALEHVLSRQSCPPELRAAVETLLLSVDELCDWMRSREAMPPVTTRSYRGDVVVSNGAEAWADRVWFRQRIYDESEARELKMASRALTDLSMAIDAIRREAAESLEQDGPVQSEQRVQHVSTTHVQDGTKTIGSWPFRRKVPVWKSIHEDVYEPRAPFVEKNLQTLRRSIQTVTDLARHIDAHGVVRNPSGTVRETVRRSNFKSGV